MVVGVFNVMFLTNDLPNARVFSSVGVWLSGFKSVRNVKRLLVNHGLDFMAMPLFLTVTQPAWGPGCSGHAGVS